jgi:hypothetical protein
MPVAISVSMLLKTCRDPVIVPLNPCDGPVVRDVGFESATPCSVSVAPAPVHRPGKGIGDIEGTLRAAHQFAVIGVFTLKMLPLFPPVTVVVCERRSP